jgi:hypothetical protein
MHELIKDACLPRQLRHDVFVRGARRLSSAERDAAVAAFTLHPLVHPTELDDEIQVPAGTAEISATLKMMLEAALQGPVRVADLLDRYPGRSSPCELVGVLVGSGQGAITAGPEARQPAPADRLNRALAARVSSVAGKPVIGALPSARLGTGYVAPRLLQYIVGRMLAGETEAEAGQWIDRLSHDLTTEQRVELSGLVDRALTQRVPLLRSLGIVPP